MNETQMQADLDQADHTISVLSHENDRLRRQNRELVSEIKIRDCITLDLQEKLSTIETRPGDLFDRLAQLRKMEER